MYSSNRRLTSTVYAARLIVFSAFAAVPCEDRIRSRCYQILYTDEAPCALACCHCTVLKSKAFLALFGRGCCWDSRPASQSNDDDSTNEDCSTAMGYVCPLQTAYAFVSCTLTPPVQSVRRSRVLGAIAAEAGGVLGLGISLRLRECGLRYGIAAPSVACQQLYKPSPCSVDAPLVLWMQ